MPGALLRPVTKLIRLLDRIPRLIGDYNWLNNAYVAVGWDEKAGKYPDGTLVAQVAIFNEFGTYNEDGTVHTPARPFMRPAYQENRPAILNLREQVVNRVNEGRLKPEKGLDILGFRLMMFVRRKILSNVGPPLASAATNAKGRPSTLERKRREGRPAVTLINTRRMLDELTYHIYTHPFSSGSQTETAKATQAKGRAASQKAEVAAQNRRQKIRTAGQVRAEKKRLRAELRRAKEKQQAEKRRANLAEKRHQKKFRVLVKRDKKRAAKAEKAQVKRFKASVRRDKSRARTAEKRQVRRFKASVRRDKKNARTAEKRQVRRFKASVRRDRKNARKAEKRQTARFNRSARRDTRRAKKAASELERKNVARFRRSAKRDERMARRAEKKQSDRFQRSANRDVQRARAQERKQEGRFRNSAKRDVLRAKYSAKLERATTPAQKARVVAAEKTRRQWARIAENKRRIAKRDQRLEKKRERQRRRTEIFLSEN